MQRSSSRLPLLCAPLLCALSCGAVESSSYTDLFHFEDAELYLQSVGIPAGLPQLRVKYKVGSWGRKLEIQGSASEVAVADVVQQPTVQWLASPTASTGVKRKHVLLMVDPDAPHRAADGSQAGTDGPVIHWLGLNCETDAKSCYDAIPYAPPAPREGTGPHRYIFVLFEQTKPPQSGDALLEFMSITNRERWGLARFMEVFRGSMEPAAVNYFSCSAAADEAQADSAEDHGSRRQPQGTTGLGPRWDSGAAPKVHDEL